MLNSAAFLKSIIDRMEFLSQKKDEITGEMREVLSEAKQEGLDPKIIKKVLQMRKVDPEKLDEEEHMVQTYLTNLQKAERQKELVKDEQGTDL